MNDEPGHWEFDRQIGTEVWTGPASRSERHGSAWLHYILDRQQAVENCLLPDGERGHASASFEEFVARGAQPSIWRVRSADGSFRYGRIEISPGQEIAFVEDESRRPRPSAAAPDSRFASDLRGDPRLGELVQADEFAAELYAALCNVIWYRRDGPDVWTCSFRGAGALVAQLRDRSEEYVDFTLSGGEGSVAPRVGAELARLGWHPRSL